MRRGFAKLLEILKLRGTDGDVVDDEIGHKFGAFAQRAQVIPRTEARVDLSVVDRIEARIGAINGEEEWQEVDAPKESGQWSIEKELQFAKASAGKAIHVSDQLDLVFHGCPGSSIRSSEY